MFVTVGMSQQAVEAFTRANLIQEAIDSCISLNQVCTAQLSFTVLVCYALKFTCTIPCIIINTIRQLCCTPPCAVEPGSGAG